MISPATATSARTPAESPSGATQNLCGRVLLVEDDPAGRRLVQSRLQAAGHDVIACSRAEEAIECAISVDPDLIISDICMPDVDGIALTQWIRMQPSLVQTPVLLITSLYDVQLLTRGLDAGADDFLTKPINSFELKTRTQGLLRSMQTVRELKRRYGDCDHGDSPVEQSNESVARRRDDSQDNPDAPRHMPARVLLIDDDTSQTRLLSAYLEGTGCDLHTVETGQAGLDWLHEHEVDLVITDILLPDLDGYQIINRIRSDGRFEGTSVLVISVLSEVEDRVRAFDAGADDFILKGFSRVEFRARVKRLLRVKQQMDDLKHRYHEAARQAVTDSLTGLVTHGYISETLQHELQAARRNNEEHSVIFVDVDHFKSFNDQFGHSVGDRVLRNVADVVAQAVRGADTPGRFGGEEFVVSLPRTGATDARHVAERIRTAVEARKIPAADTNGPRDMRVTVSLGVATFPGDAHDAESLLQRADEAMYAAKQAGRNNVVSFSERSSGKLNCPRVLIVDDEPVNIRLLKAILGGTSYHILSASNGTEALELARHSRPDVILLDAMMPGMTGFDVCRRLKQEPATRLIPIVLVTALAGRDNKLNSIEAGADAFITKPVDKDELRTQVKAFLRNKRSTDSLEDAEAVIFTLARAVEGRDASTGGHVERVSHYAVELGKAVGLSEGEVNGLRDAGIVHDIGKISIPDSVLLKPGSLDEDERRTIERHVELGYQLLKPLRTFSDALPAVRFHHERLDGSGYPLGLRGDEIPMTAQILAIADVYDALTTDRVYRPAFSQDKAFEILQDEAARGLHNMELVTTFIRLVRSW